MTRSARWGLAYFVGATALLIAPLYGALGNRVTPRVLGLPWSLVWVLGVIVANVAVLTWLYRGHAVPVEDEAELDHG